MREAIRFAAAVCSGLLTAAAFPPLEWLETAWIAWVPLLLLLPHVSSRRAFQLGFLAGAVCWLCSIFWLTHVTWAGWFMLSLYCALFTGGFTYAAHGLMRQWNREHVGGAVGLMIVLPLVWVGFEYLRCVLFTGFAWNPLGGSQFAKINLIQMAAWTGVYGVSALIVLVNTGIAQTLNRYMRYGIRGKRGWHPELMLVFLALAGALFLGTRAARTEEKGYTLLRVAVIQPNIPQYEKWTKAFVDSIYARLGTLTELAIHAGKPDLVIWPETAVPDYVRESRRSYMLVRDMARLGSPILVGSMDIAWEDEGAPRYYNSSILFDVQGAPVEVYDKQHLVMFGEYIPLRRLLPFMTAMTPIEESFDPGTESTVFRLEDPDIPFSVLICFEDTVARLARRAARNGARLLINQTNVAWFEESSASRQHMTHSVFRAVETRTPAIRAANTGVSCGIDSHGRIHDLLADVDGHTFIAGFNIISSHIPPEDRAWTFYTRHGDVFAWTGIIAAATVLAAAWYQGRNARMTKRLEEDTGNRMPRGTGQGMPSGWGNRIGKEVRTR